jgi:hypothetical protein
MIIVYNKNDTKHVDKLCRKILVLNSKASGAHSNHHAFRSGVSIFLYHKTHNIYGIYINIFVSTYSLPIHKLEVFTL